jgi:hypothetical protein
MTNERMDKFELDLLVEAVDDKVANLNRLANRFVEDSETQHIIYQLRARYDGLMGKLIELQEKEGERR